MVGSEIQVMAHLVEVCVLLIWEVSRGPVQPLVDPHTGLGLVKGAVSVPGSECTHQPAPLLACLPHQPSSEVRLLLLNSQLC